MKATLRQNKVVLAFICGLALSVIFAFTQSDNEDKAYGKVQEVDGVLVFMNCIPAQPYETAFEFTTIAHGGFGCPNISEMAQACVKSAKKKGFPFDAIIAGTTKSDLAIKFK
jgi:hypothetical protein